MTGATQSDCCQVMRRRKEDDIIARSRLACSRAKAGAVLRRARGDVFGSVVVPLGGRLASLSSCRRAAGVLLELFSQPNIICFVVFVVPWEGAARWWGCLSRMFMSSV